MSANPTTPPTTPPAIAGTFSLALGTADALDEALLVGIGPLVDSGPPVPQVRIHLRYSPKRSYQLLWRQ